MPDESTRTVLVALGAGLGVALAKAGAAAFTGSSAMAADASHSLADTAKRPVPLRRSASQLRRRSMTAAQRRLDEQQLAVLDAEPLAAGWEDQRWTLARRSCRAHSARAGLSRLMACSARKGTAGSGE